MYLPRLNLQKMSDFSRKLYDYERSYVHAEGIKAALLGRAVFIGVSMIVHAEAVCRAARLILLVLESFFSEKKKQEYFKEKKYASEAYIMSVKSLYAFFQASILEHIEETKSNLEPMPVELSSQQTISSSLSVASEWLSMGDVSNVSAYLDDESLNLGSTPLPTAVSSEDMPLGGDSSSSDGVLHDGISSSPLTSSNWLNPEDPYEEQLLEFLRQRNLSRSRNPLYVQPSTDAVVRQKLKDNKAKASREIELGNKRSEFLEKPPLPEAHALFPGWQIVKSQLGRIPFESCSFKTDPSTTLSPSCYTSHFSIVFSNQVRYPVTVFGVFDPSGGNRAMNYVIEHFETVFSTKLGYHGQAGISKTALWNAMNETCKHIDVTFKSSFNGQRLHPELPPIIDQGVNYTLVAVIEDFVCTANAGNSRALLCQNEETERLSVPTVSNIGPLFAGNSLFPEHLANAKGIGFASYGGLISSLPEITITKITHPATLFIGSSSIFDEYESSAIAAVLESDVESPSHTIGYWVYQNAAPSFDPIVNEQLEKMVSEVAEDFVSKRKLVHTKGIACLTASLTPLESATISSIPSISDEQFEKLLEALDPDSALLNTPPVEELHGQGASSSSNLSTSFNNEIAPNTGSKGNLPENNSSIFSHETFINPSQDEVQSIVSSPAKQAPKASSVVSAPKSNPSNLSNVEVTPGSDEFVFVNNASASHSAHSKKTTKSNSSRSQRLQNGASSIFVNNAEPSLFVGDDYHFPVPAPQDTVNENGDDLDQVQAKSATGSHASEVLVDFAGN